MSAFRFGYITAPLLGALWMTILSVTISVAMSFTTGDAIRPNAMGSLVWGALAGGLTLWLRHNLSWGAIMGCVLMVALLAGLGPIQIGEATTLSKLIIAGASLVIFFGWSFWVIVDQLPAGALTRHEFEGAVIRLLMGFGYIFFTVIVLIPFYVMLMTSFKNQSELMQNPLDFSIDLSKGAQLFRSYHELFILFNFDTYLLNSFFI